GPYSAELYSAVSTQCGRKHGWSGIQARRRIHHLISGQLPSASTEADNHTNAAPRAAENIMSNRRERTANTPTRSESQVLRTTASHSMAAPKRNVARRQCSIRLIAPEATTPRPNSAINTHCSQPGKGEGGRWISCGFDTESIILTYSTSVTVRRAFLRAQRCWKPRKYESMDPRHLGSEK